MTPKFRSVGHFNVTDAGPDDCPYDPFEDLTITREALDELEEEGRVAALHALADGPNAPMIPRVARGLLVDFARCLARQGLLHPFDVDVVRRALGDESA